MSAFNGSNLRTLRLFRNKTLDDLAGPLGVSKQLVSRWEKNDSAPGYQHTNALAKELGVNSSYFENVNIKRLEEYQFHFRKLRTTRVKTKDHVIALGEIFRQLAEFLDAHLELPEYDFPTIECSSDADIERAAEFCRRHWALGLGPIENVTRVAENAGALVTDFTGVGKEIDALSIATQRPIIVRNSAKESPGRLRFDLSHEIGHFVMHEGRLTGDKFTEGQANRFASAFLLPRSTFINEFPVSNRINWRRISEIKQTFKVSKAAILYRAKQLDLLSDQQYTGAIIRLKKHEGRNERDDYLIEPMEQPELIHNALQTMKDHMGLSVQVIEEKLGFTDESFPIVLGRKYRTLPAKYRGDPKIVSLF